MFKSPPLTGAEKFATEVLLMNEKPEITLEISNKSSDRLMKELAQFLHLAKEQGLDPHKEFQAIFDKQKAAAIARHKELEEKIDDFGLF